MEENANEVKISSEKIKKNLILHMVNIAVTDTEAQFSVPKSLEQNKLLWARVMYHNKKI